MNAPDTTLENSETYLGNHRSVASIRSFHSDLITLRRELHQNPEIGFEEHFTSALVARELERYGVDEIHRGIGKTGVVAVVRGRSDDSGRRVGLRADMDALPMNEDNEFAHRSRRPGMMHGCGHDGHTTMLLGGARYLAATRNFDGTVHFIFQPAEEGLGGAKAMIDDGLFERFPCAAVFGMHNRPTLEVGRFAVRGGPMMAGGAFFDIRVTGRGAHGARPEFGVDAALVAAQIAVSLQSVVARNVSPLDTAVLSVTREDMDVILLEAEKKT